MPALDDFTGQWNLSSPARHAAAVTPSDTVSLNTVSVIYVGVTGNVTVVTAGGETVTFVGVNAGTILPVWVSRVNNTNTTATNMVALSNRAVP
jgi:hypothetical protein